MLRPSPPPPRRNVVVGTLAAATYALAPVTLVTAVMRDGMWDSALLLGFPLLACAIAIVPLLLGIVRPIGAFPLRYVAIVAVLVVAISAIHVATGRQTSLAKALAMLLATAILPSTIAWVTGARRAIYATGCGLLPWLTLMLAGSVFVPEWLFVPAYGSYQPVRGGWFSNPNAYGAAGLVVQCVVVCLWLDRPWPATARLHWRVALAGVFVLASVGVLRSASRASIIASIALCLLTLVARRRLVTLFLLALLVASALAFLPEQWEPLRRVPLLDAVLTKVERADPSSSRLTLWRGLVQSSLKTSPLFGLGAGTSVEASEALGFSGTHNAYLKILVEFGLVGLVVTTWLILRVWRTCAWWDRHGIPSRGIAIVFLVLLAHSSFESHIFSFASTPVGLMFWQYALVTRTES